MDCSMCVLCLSDQLIHFRALFITKSDLGKARAVPLALNFIMPAIGAQTGELEACVRRLAGPTSPGQIILDFCDSFCVMHENPSMLIHWHILELTAFTLHPENPAQV